MADPGSEVGAQPSSGCDAKACDAKARDVKGWARWSAVWGVWAACAG